MTEEQILALSPDASSTKSGKDLARMNKWVSVGVDERALWGECQGSGSNPYRTQLDLRETAFKCSCPSRKFPCKHGLGLFLLYARQPADFKTVEQPDWVKDWIGKRAEKQEKKAETAAKPVDEKAQAKRAEARTSKVTAGLQELELWVKDLIRNGLITIPGQPGFWEQPARRMSDAQASGVTTLLTQLGDINFYKEGWQSELLQQLARIYIVAEGFKRIDELPELMQTDLRSVIGWSMKQEELKAMEGVSDNWLILGRQTEREQELTVQRNWLVGEKSGRYALIINFAFKNQPLDVTLVPGTAFSGELVFFPGSYPLRAVLKTRDQTAEFVRPEGLADWVAAEDVYSAAVSAYPWIDRLPMLVKNLALQPFQEEWVLKDSSGRFMFVHEKFDLNWQLLAIGGGHPLDMMVVREKDKVVPIGVWNRGGYKLLNS